MISADTILDSHHYTGVARIGTALKKKILGPDFR